MLFLLYCLETVLSCCDSEKSHLVEGVLGEEGGHIVSSVYVFSQQTGGTEGRQ